MPSIDVLPPTVLDTQPFRGKYRVQTNAKNGTTNESESIKNLPTPHFHRGNICLLRSTEAEIGTNPIRIMEAMSDSSFESNIHTHSAPSTIETTPQPFRKRYVYMCSPTEAREIIDHTEPAEITLTIPWGSDISPDSQTMKSTPPASRSLRKRNVYMLSSTTAQETTDTIISAHIVSTSPFRAEQQSEISATTPLKPSHKSRGKTYDHRHDGHKATKAGDLIETVRILENSPQGMGVQDPSTTAASPSSPTPDPSLG